MGVTQNRAAIISLLRTRQRSTGAVEDYIAQMNALGESLRPQTIAAMRVFDNYVAVNDLRSFITLALPLASDNFLGFEAALYRPPGYVGIVNNGFTAANYTRTGGLVSSGASWINTGLQSSAVASLSTGMLGVSILSSGINEAYDIGATSGFFHLYAQFSDGGVYARHFDAATSAIGPVTVASAAGFTLMNRLSSTDFKVWKDGVTIGSLSTAAAGTVPGTTIGLCVRFSASSRTYSGFIIGVGMPDAAIPGFMSAWQTMQAAIRA